MSARNENSPLPNILPPPSRPSKKESSTFFIPIPRFFVKHVPSCAFVYLSDKYGSVERFHIPPPAQIFVCCELKKKQLSWSVTFLWFFFTKNKILISYLWGNYFGKKKLFLSPKFRIQSDIRGREMLLISFQKPCKFVFEVSIQLLLFLKKIFFNYWERRSMNSTKVSLQIILFCWFL
jgi:hypothetical protein